MLCKYLREVCMRQFNRFWAAHVPGIRPTAGYPGDAKRFFEEIRPTMAKLGLTDDQVWRKRELHRNVGRSALHEHTTRVAGGAMPAPILKLLAAAPVGATTSDAKLLDQFLRTPR